MVSLQVGRCLRAWLPVANVVLLAAVAAGSLAYLVRVDMEGGIRPGVLVQARAELHAPQSLPPNDGPAFTGSLPSTTGEAASRDDSDYQADPPADSLTMYLDDAEALAACEDRVRAVLAFPNSLNRLLASTTARHAPGDDAVITFNFEAVNGAGFVRREQAECVLDGGRVARLSVTPPPDSAAIDQSVFSIPPSTK